MQAEALGSRFPLLNRSDRLCRSVRARAISQALESADVKFLVENDGGPGVRLRHRQQKKR
jgi:hypothetical protein